MVFVLQLVCTALAVHRRIVVAIQSWRVHMFWNRSQCVDDLASALVGFRHSIHRNVSLSWRALDARNVTLEYHEENTLTVTVDTRFCFLSSVSWRSNRRQCR